MGVNKVVYGTTVLVDLTEDTITEDDLAEGVTAHNASGERIVGRMKQTGIMKNLLDNPFFEVNQRGFTQSIRTTGYCVDRWMISTAQNGTCYATVEKTSDGMHATSTAEQVVLSQILESGIAAGKTVTATLDVKGAGKIKLYDNAWGEAAEGFNFDTGAERKTVSVTASLTGELKRFAIELAAGGEINVYAAKLEYGSVSTYTENERPDYGTELMKCQRFFYRLKESWAFFFPGVVHSATETRLTFFLPVPMRSDSIAVVRDGSWDQVNVSVGTTALAATGLVQSNAVAVKNINTVTVRLTHASTNARGPCVCRINNGTLDFVADL